jgi:hypothetical protein
MKKTVPPKMAEANILDILVEHLRLNTKDREILIPLLALDKTLGIPKGSTEKYIEQAAAKVDMKIVEPRDGTHIRLRKIRRGRVWIGV